MNHATTYHFRNNQSPSTGTTKEVTPTVERVRKLVTKTKRRQPGAKRQTAVRANSNVTDGFLKCTFLPKLKPAPSAQTYLHTERDFYQSLSRLAEYYCVEPMQTENYEFPYNMALAIWDIEKKVKRININWESFKLLQDCKQTFFVSEEKYDTGTTLYYIPVVPIFRMLHDKERKQTAQLLISVCSYLYHIAAIPYYRQQDSYLYWLYEMHKDWIEQDEETEETQANRDEITKAEYIGNIIEQKLFNLANLNHFQKRLSQFKSCDKFDRECFQVASKAFDLYVEYPTATIFRNASQIEEDPYNRSDENEFIGMEKYISFISDIDGWLYESLSESINNEFNEYQIMQEPVIYKSFDSTDISTNNLDFENRLFAILDNVCTILHDYKTIKNEHPQ